jgi:outer membrane usher protein
VLPGSPPPSQAAYAGGTNPHVNLVTASYSVPVAGIATVYATGFKDLHDNRSYGAGIGISFALDDTTSASVGSSVDSGHVTSSASVAKSAVNVNNYGYRVQDSEGAAAERLAEGEFLSPWGHVSVGVDQSPGQMAGRAGARGAVTWLDGNVFASDQINDSFAVVHTGDVAGVPVLYENRSSGASDSDGRLLVPSLLSYQNNRISVDASKLPPDIDVGQTSVVVRPPDRSGVVVEFNTRKVFAALLKLRDSKGENIPLGSVVKVEGAADQPVGYDGEAYVTGLKPTNRVAVERPDGTVCIVQFAYKPVPGDIPDIGPLRCQ